jgi:hypothetical protein
MGANTAAGWRLLTKPPIPGRPHFERGHTEVKFHPRIRSNDNERATLWANSLPISLIVSSSFLAALLKSPSDSRD